MTKFYLLEDYPNLPENKYVRWTNKVKLEQITCPKTRSHMRSGKRLTELTVLVPNNNNDIIQTWYSDLLINDTVVNLFSKNNVTGYNLNKVNIARDLRKGKNAGQKLYELIVTGSGGNIHPFSGYKLIETCKDCGARKHKSFTKGLIVNESQWDNTDIFTVVEYHKYILVTQKVKDLIESNEITGCIFIPAEQFKIDPMVISE